MKQLIRKLALVALASTAICASANAASVITDVGGSVGGLAQSVTGVGGGVSTFDDVPAKIPYDTTTSTPFTSVYNYTGDGVVMNNPGGDPGGLYAEPYLDRTNYLAVIATPDVGPAIMKIAGGVTASLLGLYWGSIDDYNSIEFYLAGALVDTFLGGDLPPATGSQDTDAGNRYIVLSNVLGGLFDEVHFISSGNSFELDNVSTNAVPIPGAALLFGTGLAGLAYLGRRRSKAKSLTAAA